jgi:transcriptional regulator with XRE-family HTH domain
LPALREPMELRERADLAQLMRLKGDTVRSLADRAGLSQQTVHRLRNVDHSVCHRDTAIRVSEALGVALERLFRPAERKNPSHYVATGA